MIDIYVLAHFSGLTRSNSQLVPPTPPPMPKTSSITGSKRDKSGHDNQSEPTFCFFVCNTYLLDYLIYFALYLYLFISSLSWRRLSLVLNFSHRQWGSGVRTLGRQHHLGWPGDGPHACPTCHDARPEWWKYPPGYIQNSNILHFFHSICDFLKIVCILYVELMFILDMTRLENVNCKIWLPDWDRYLF